MLRRYVSRGLEDHILLIIGADPDRLWVTEEGEREKKIIKSKAGEATTEEIESNLRSFGFKWSKSTLYRRLGVLRDRDLVRQGNRKGVYVITGKGAEVLERRHFELKGRGTLNTYARRPIWVQLSAAKGEKVEYLDLYVRFFEEDFIRDFFENSKKTARMDIGKLVGAEGSISIGVGQDVVWGSIIKAAVMTCVASPEYLIRMLSDLGASDEQVRAVYDGFKTFR